MTKVIDVDLTKYFDTIQHHVLLAKIARRVQDPEVMGLVKQIISAAGKVGVPQGGLLSPLAANIYLNDLDWLFDDIRCKTADNGYEAVNYHRFADDIVIPVSGHHTKNAWAERALQRLQQHLIPLGVSLNTEKTKIVNLLDGESFGFLGFDFRRVQNRKKSGYFICMTPGKKARKAIKARIRTIITSGGSVSSKDIVARIKRVLGGGGLETDLSIPRQSFTRQNCFAWWKRHLKVYHLIARSAYGLMVQILAGLITYLLLAIYCHRNFQEKSLHPKGQTAANRD